MSWFALSTTSSPRAFPPHSWRFTAVVHFRCPSRMAFAVPGYPAVCDDICKETFNWCTRVHGRIGAFKSSLLLQRARLDGTSWYKKLQVFETQDLQYNCSQTRIFAEIAKHVDGLKGKAERLRKLCNWSHHSAFPRGKFPHTTVTDSVLHDILVALTELIDDILS